MPTRPFSVVVDAADHDALARFWAEALAWDLYTGEPDEAVVACPDAPGWGEGGPPLLVFGPVGEPKQGKNRVHLDLTSGSTAEQEAITHRLIDLGALEVDIGQRDVPWTVLADPEGNEFCVLDPREDYREARGIAAVLLDCADPAALAPYWEAATGWAVVDRQGDYVAFQHPASEGTRVELLAVPDAKQVKDRLHIDLAPVAGNDQEAEVARLERAGARRIDIGQSEVPWVVLADPEGHEHCVLTPR